MFSLVPQIKYYLMKNGAFLFIFLLLSFGAIAQTDSGQEPASRQEQKATKKIKVFPNPATNVVNVLGLINSSRATIIVSDISGNEVLAHQWAIRNNAVSIPVPNLNSGIYVVRIESKEQRVQTKFYKK